MHIWGAYLFFSSAARGIAAEILRGDSRGDWSITEEKATKVALDEGYERSSARPGADDRRRRGLPKKFFFSLKLIQQFYPYKLSSEA